MNSTPLPVTIVVPGDRDSLAIHDIGNFRQDVQKTFRLIYSGIPEGAEPFVRYAISGGAPQDVMLDDSLEAVIDVPYGAALTTIEWRALYGSEDLLLGVSPTPEILTADKLNTFTYTATAAGAKFEDANSDTIWGAAESGAGRLDHPAVARRRSLCGDAHRRWRRVLVQRSDSRNVQRHRSAAGRLAQHGRTRWVVRCQQQH